MLHLVIARSLLDEEKIDYALVLQELAVADQASPNDYDVHYLRGKVFLATGKYVGEGFDDPRLQSTAMPSYFPLLLATHILLAVCLVLPSILLPFALRTRRATVESESRVVQTLLWGQSHGTLVIGAGLALTGIGLISVLGPTMLQQTWLLLALTIYFVNLGIAYERKGDHPKALDAWRRAKKAGVRFAPLPEWIDAKERIYGGAP